MVINALNMCKDAIVACLGWFDQIMTQIDGLGIVVAAFLVVLIVTMLLLPLRGGGVGGLDYISDLTGQTIYNSTHHGKYANTKMTMRSKYYRGKFSKDNSSARMVRRGRHTNKVPRGSFDRNHVNSGKG